MDAAKFSAMLSILSWDITGVDHEPKSTCSSFHRYVARRNEMRGPIRRLGSRMRHYGLAMVSREVHPSEALAARPASADN
jgi:hypothetical protein